MKGVELDLLYKYRPFDSEDPPSCERVLSMLRGRTVWMARPDSFNDPFDCQPSILRNKETERQALEAIIRNRLGTLKPALRTHTQLADRHGQPIPRRTLVGLRRLLESHQPAEVKYKTLQTYFIEPPDGEKVSGELKARLRQVGVMSLSETPTDMLMWAHYASQHRGFCLGFERSEGSLLSDTAHTKPVRYLATYPALDLDALEVSLSISMGDDSISDCCEIDIQEPHLQAIYSKAKDWAYEREWRVLVESGGQLSPYPGPLRKVIFGLRCGQASRKDIAHAALEAADGPIEFAEIKQTDGSFALQVRDLYCSTNTRAAGAM